MSTIKREMEGGGINLDIPRPIKEIGCQKLMKDDSVKKNGRLRKPISVIGGIGGLLHDYLNVKWFPRHVVVCGGCLYIFKNETSPKYEKATTLYGFCNALPLDTTKWSFRIVNAIEESKSIILGAASEEDMNTWISVLRDEIVYANRQIYSTEAPTVPTGFTGRTGSSIPTGPTTRGPLPDFTPRMKKEAARISMRFSDSLEYEDEEQDNYTEIEGICFGFADQIRPIENEEEKINNSFQHNQNPKSERTNEVEISQRPNPTGSEGNNSSRSNLLGTLKDRPVPPIPRIQKPPPPLPEAKSKPEVPNKPEVPSKPEVPNKPEVPKKPKNTPSVNNENFVKLDMESTYSVDHPDSKCKKPTVPMNADNDYEGGALEQQDEEDIYDDIVSEDQNLMDESLKRAFWNGGAAESLDFMKTQKTEGTYLVRNGEHDEHRTLMVCVVEPGQSEIRVRKLRIFQKEKLLYLGQTSSPLSFRSYGELFQYYTLNSLPGRTTKLTKPYTVHEEDDYD